MSAADPSSLEKYRNMFAGDLIMKLIDLRTSRMFSTIENQNREVGFVLQALNENLSVETITEIVAANILEGNVSYDAGKGAEKVDVKTQNFDVMEIPYEKLSPGWYIAKFITTEVVEVRQDHQDRYVVRCGEERHRFLAEFKFLQKVTFDPAAPKEPSEQQAFVEENFQTMWMKLSTLYNHMTTGRIPSEDDKDAVKMLMAMFQNPGVIKHKD